MNTTATMERNTTPPVSPIEQEFAHALELHRAGQIDQAVLHYARLVAHEPRHAMSWNNLGVVLRQQGRRIAAVACYQRALALQPGFATVHTNLGNVLRDLGRFEESEAACRRGVELQPENAGALQSLALALQDLNRQDEAIRTLDRAVELMPGEPNLRWDRALNILMKGDYVYGFQEYEVRWDLPENPRAKIDRPEWRGEPLEGRTLLIYAEQGFGDTIQFMRYLPMIKERNPGARILFHCQPPLVRLAQGLPGLDGIVPRGASLPNFDTHIALLSLSKILGTTLETVPNTVPYLTPPPGAGFILEPAPGIKLKVGITWAGRPTHKNDANRSVALERFLPLMGDPHIAFYSLQKGPRAADILGAGATPLVHDLNGRIEDFADSARILQQLDLVISVDTSIVHLSGALGRPTWVLLPPSTDWRWVRGRADSPWYPTLRLFHQRRTGDWDELIERVRRALAERLEECLLEERLSETGAPFASIPPNETAMIRAPQQIPAAPSVPEIVEISSASSTIDGRPRFVMPIPRQSLAEPGLALLARHEVQYFGYDHAARLFLDRHLQAGDLFVDVGAKWGVHTLTAVSRWPGEVKAIAVEPAPERIRSLEAWIAHNGLADNVTVVAAALGAGSDGAPNLDSLIASRDREKRARVFLRIDVGGAEPDVIAGAGALIESGRVQAILWTRGRNADAGPGRSAFETALEHLGARGFTHTRFPNDNLGGPLTPYLFNDELVNVVSLAPGFLRRPHYCRQPGPTPTPARPSSIALERTERIRWTERLIAAKATDGGRWADPAALEAGAEERARRVAPQIADASHILDLGAGSMWLREALIGRIRYTPADLIMRDALTQVVDLNAGDFPAGRFDGVVMLETLEYLHDPEGVLRRAREAASHLILSYRLHEGAATEDRRADGLFNDFTDEEMRALLGRAGWRIAGRETGSGYELFLCRAEAD